MSFFGAVGASALSLAAGAPGRLIALPFEAACYHRASRGGRAILDGGLDPGERAWALLPLAQGIAWGRALAHLAWLPWNLAAGVPLALCLESFLFGAVLFGAAWAYGAASFAREGLVLFALKAGAWGLACLPALLAPFLLFARLPAGWGHGGAAALCLFWLWLCVFHILEGIEESE